MFNTSAVVSHTPATGQYGFSSWAQGRPAAGAVAPH